MSFHYLCYRWHIQDRNRSSISHSLKSILQSSTFASALLSQIPFQVSMYRRYIVIGGSQSLRRGRIAYHLGSSRKNNNIIQQHFHGTASNALMYTLIYFFQNEKVYLSAVFLILLNVKFKKSLLRNIPKPLRKCLTVFLKKSIFTFLHNYEKIIFLTHENIVIL